MEDNVRAQDAPEHEVCHFLFLKFLMLEGGKNKQFRISPHSRIQEDFWLSAAHLCTFEQLFKEKMTGESTHDLQLMSAVCRWSA